VSNVYAAPTANISDSNLAAETNLFAVNGRIGRLRWIAYMLAMWLMAALIIGVVSFAAPIGKHVTTTVAYLPAVLNVLALLLVSRRRLQDLGVGAVFLLGLFIPFVNLYFFFMMIFKRGDEGSNEYGPSPAPNGRSVYLLLMLIPAFVLIGILAAIALPGH
jgi:uncharacterized membrane protein YhaH (DUF805 family)